MIVGEIEDLELLKSKLPFIGRKYEGWYLCMLCVRSEA
jgi:hypothetical protein